MSTCISQIVSKIMEIRISKLEVLSEVDKIKLIKMLEKLN